MAQHNKNSGSCGIAGQKAASGHIHVPPRESCRNPQTCRHTHVHAGFGPRACRKGYLRSAPPTVPFGRVGHVQGSARNMDCLGRSALLASPHSSWCPCGLHVSVSEIDTERQETSAEAMSAHTSWMHCLYGHTCSRASSAPSPHGLSMTVTSRPIRCIMSIHKWLNWP